MTWLHIILVISSASPLPHSFHFTSLTLDPLLLFQHARHSIDWPVPFPEVCFCLLFPQLIHIPRRLSERAVPGYSPPIHLICEIFLAHLIVCSLGLRVYQSSIYLLHPNGRLRVAKDFRDMAVDKTKKP